MEYYFYFYFINHVVRANQHMIGLDKLSELAQDRCGWKEVVLDCSANDNDDSFFSQELPNTNLVNYANLEIREIPVEYETVDKQVPALWHEVKPKVRS